MANRVSVNVNVSDRSSAGLASLRRSLRRAQRQARAAGTDIRFNVRIPDDATRREIRRIRRALRGQPVTLRTRLDPPTPSPVTWRRRIARTLGRPVTVPVRLAGRGLLGTVRGPLRSLRGLVSGILQDGVGQGIINGFKAGGPVGMAFLGALLLSLASVIGAALSGLLVTALGLAFVGIGGASAAMSDQIKAQWSETLGVLKEEFAEVGKPLIPVLDRALERLETMAQKAGPKLQAAIEATAPATEAFINRILDGFESFAGAAFQPIMDAWNVFAPVFGEQWDEFMRELGESFADMANLVKEHPAEIALALEVVFETLELIIDTVTLLGKVWVLIVRNIGDSIGFLLGAVAGLANGFLTGIDLILAGLEELAGLIGLDGPIKTARRNLQDFRDTAVGRLEEMAVSAYGWGEALDKANRKRRLEADISSWQASLKRARDDLSRTSNQKARAKLKADISDLENKIRNARNQLSALNGTTATTYVQTVNLSGGRASGRGGTRGGRLAHGGIVGAAASGGVRSNMTLVGEEGPELVNLPTGSHVRPAGWTRAAMGGPGAERTATLRLEAGTSDVDRLLMTILRRAIRNEGGDVQVVLGSGR